MKRAISLLLSFLLVIPLCACSPGTLIQIGQAVLENAREHESQAPSHPPEEPVSTSEPVPSQGQPAAHRTLMVYMIGSTLEYDGAMTGLASMDIDEMLAATYSDGLNIIIQTGGSEQWQNEQIRGGCVQRFKVEKGGLRELDDLGRVSMAKKSTLSEFIKFAHKEYPAEEYLLVLWDHGGGVPNGFGSDVLFPGDTLTDVDIGDALELAGVHFNAIVFNACLMCSLEVYMAVKDHADYAVAAESVVTGTTYDMIGSGIDYTDFVNQLNDTDRPVVACCEVLLNDYIGFLKDNGFYGTMSIVRMDRVQEVFNAYARYIRKCYEDLQDGAFLDILRARDACGEFDGFDFVDLNTLATKYENEYSTDLQNAVSSAIETTRSYGYSNGRGITAYFPYDLCYLYDEGRKSLVKLNYDTSVIGFYDLLASSELYYMDLTEYAGTWFVQPAGDVPMPSQSVSEFELTVEDMGGYQAVVLNDDDWDLIADGTIRKEVWYQYDDRYLFCLGENDAWTEDDYGNLTIRPPQNWLQLNGMLATADVITVSDSGDSVYREYFVYAYVDDEPAYLLVTRTGSDAPSVLGYFPCDWDTGEYDNGYRFDGSEKIELAVYVYDMEEDEYTYRYYTAALTPSELRAVYDPVDLSGYGDVLIRYSLEDVYGNYYYTDFTFCD